ncbi:hypothetical protein GKC56_01985 [Neisseriaceae bacterium PsAf]|nr:hypothetical protein [Neisseriaceae bacterium PsAf]MCV2503562.1 hypothetical protein [Neisseriaceae bacterium]
MPAFINVLVHSGFKESKVITINANQIVSIEEVFDGRFELALSSGKVYKILESDYKKVLEEIASKVKSDYEQVVQSLAQAINDYKDLNSNSNE